MENLRKRLRIGKQAIAIALNEAGIKQRGDANDPISKRMVNGKVGRHIQENQNYRCSSHRNYHLRNNSIIMILDVVKLAIGAGTHIMTNRQQRKMLESDAAMLHAQKMANGEIEYQQQVRQSNDKGWKDEFVLILISLPFYC